LLVQHQHLAEPGTGENGDHHLDEQHSI
jgi:hypothetical protein